MGIRSVAQTSAAFFWVLVRKKVPLRNYKLVAHDRLQACRRGRVAAKTNQYADINRASFCPCAHQSGVAGGRQGDAGGGGQGCFSAVGSIRTEKRCSAGQAIAHSEAPQAGVAPARGQTLDRGSPTTDTVTKTPPASRHRPAKLLLAAPLRGHAA